MNRKFSFKIGYESNNHSEIQDFLKEEEKKNAALKVTKKNYKKL